MTAVVGVAPSQPGTMSLPADGRMFSPQIYAQNSRINFTLPDLSTDSVAGPTMKKGDSAYMTLANDMGQLVATSFKLAAALSPPYGRWQQTTFSGGRLSNFGEHLNPWVATTWAGDRGQDCLHSRGSLSLRWQARCGGLKPGTIVARCWCRSGKNGVTTVRMTCIW